MPSTRRVSAQADALLLRPLSTEAFEHDCIFVYDPVGRNVWNGLLYARKPGTGIATPSSRCRVDGVDENAP